MRRLLITIETVYYVENMYVTYAERSSALSRLCGSCCSVHLLLWSRNYSSVNTMHSYATFNSHCLPHDQTNYKM